MEIAECRPQDVEVLERFMPSTSVDGRHAARFARQEAGESSYLVPWIDGTPVGHAEVRWTGGRAPEVRAAHPDCPEINGLLVWPESVRSLGVGTALIHAAEELALRRGIGLMGLGVGEDNARAAALYARLGYLPTLVYLDPRAHVDAEGVLHEYAERCRFLVRKLR